MKADEAAERTRTVKKMFGAIAPRYDLLNRLLSFGVDVGWRRAMVSRLPKGRLKVLDLACGTGDVSIEIMRARPDSVVYGADLSLGMILAGKPKITKRLLEDAVLFTACSAEELPYPDAFFDAMTIAFGIRNVTRREIALAEIHRVLKPGGKALILDFSMPKNPIIAAGYGMYFHRVLPLLGGIVSGNFEAYRYLPKSVENFPPREKFAQLMENAGFSGTTWTDYTMGVATLYEGNKAK